VIFRSLLGACALVFALIGFSPSAQAADLAASWRDQGARSLIISYRVAPADRLAVRTAMKTGEVARLRKLKASGELESYRLLASRYIDAGGWDFMLVLDFTSAEALARWKAVEAAAPAGLGPQALKHVTWVESVPTDRMFAKAAPHRADDPPPVYLVVPYDYLVSIDEYLAYLKGYLAPQTDGWIGEGALSSYGVYLARYPAGRVWSAQLVLAYRGDAGLARRDAVTRAVRARLTAASPEWKAFADNKQKLRTEKQPVIADEIAASGR
jgi:hypothetical protein